VATIIKRISFESTGTDRCSIQLKGAPEGATAAASVEIMDSTLARFFNPPKPVTANFLRQQLSDMQNEFQAYAQ
jgi:hypothetical protein